MKRRTWKRRSGWKNPTKKNFTELPGAVHRTRRASLLANQVVLIVALSGPAGAAEDGSLIVNGSFEEALRVVTFVNVRGAATSITGWVVTGEAIDIVSDSYWQAADGILSIDLDGSVRSRISPPFMRGGVSQAFPTTPGTRYQVSFDLSGNPVPKPVTKRLRISAAGQSQEYTFDVTGRNFRDMGWTPQTWAFTANDESTTLEFTSLSESPLTGYGPAIDNVSVRPLDDAQPLAITENETEIQVNLEAGVLFDSGKYDLKPEATEALQGLAVLLESHSELPILIEGHTDRVGRPEANQVLSENRANAVRDWLVSTAGIASDRIATRGLGQTSPVATNDTPDGRQKNRRVEIRLQKHQVNRQ